MRAANGGSGLIGGKLICELFNPAMVKVICFFTNTGKSPKDFSIYTCGVLGYKTEKILAGVFEGTDAIINLVGESIAAKRWTPAQEQKILSSRIDSTRAIVAALKRANCKPSVLLNASAVGYYGNVPEGEVTEGYPKGSGFLADVCEQWEMEALTARELGVRVVLIRTGIVLIKTAACCRNFFCRSDYLQVGR